MLVIVQTKHRKVTIKRMNWYCGQFQYMKSKSHPLQITNWMKFIMIRKKRKWLIMLQLKRQYWTNDCEQYKVCHTFHFGRLAKRIFSQLPAAQWSAWHPKYHPFRIQYCRKITKIHQTLTSTKNPYHYTVYKRRTKNGHAILTFQCHATTAKVTWLHRALIIYRPRNRHEIHPKKRKKVNAWNCYVPICHRFQFTSIRKNQKNETSNETLTSIEINNKLCLLWENMRHVRILAKTQLWYWHNSFWIAKVNQNLNCKLFKNIF